MATILEKKIRADTAPRSAVITWALPLYAWMTQIAYGCGMTLHAQLIVVYYCVGLYAMRCLHTWPTLVLIMISGLAFSSANVMLDMSCTWKSFGTACLRLMGIILIFGLQTWACVILEAHHHW